MLITSARRSVNSDWVAEASFFKGRKALRMPDDSGEEIREEIQCEVIVLTFSSGKEKYYAANLNTIVLVSRTWEECHCDPLFFVDLLANFFS
jgi:hypothetical protein